MVSFTPRYCLSAPASAIQAPPTTNPAAQTIAVPITFSGTGIR